MVIVAVPPAPCIANDAEAWNAAPLRLHEKPLIVGADTTAAAVVAGAAAFVVTGAFTVVAGACTVRVTGAAACVVSAGTAGAVVGAVVAGSGVQVVVAVAVEVTVAKIVGAAAGGWGTAARRTATIVIVSDTPATTTAAASSSHRMGRRWEPLSPSHGASLYVLISPVPPPAREPTPHPAWLA